MPPCEFKQDDFVGDASGGDLAGMAQHVLGEVAPLFQPHAGLARHEGLEAFPAQLEQHRGSGNVAVPLGAVFYRNVGEDGWGHGLI